MPQLTGQVGPSAEPKLGQLMPKGPHPSLASAGNKGFWGWGWGNRISQQGLEVSTGLGPVLPPTCPNRASVSPSVQGLLHLTLSEVLTLNTWIKH